MKPESLRISKVFANGGDVLFILPHFQREYTWEKVNWETLLTDVTSIYQEYKDDDEPEHFMGSLVVINDGMRSGTVPAFKLVDGQQRLTTISLALCALATIIKDSHPAVSKKVQKLLKNQDEAGFLKYKLLPTTKYGDRDAYVALLDGLEPTTTKDSRIPAAYDYLHTQMSNWVRGNTVDPERLFKVLANCLQVVFIELDQRERPYEIFESLNAKGKPLSQADLVRNYIAMRLPEAQQEVVFDKYWAVIEQLLQEKRIVGRSGLGELTAFLRHYLAMRTGTLCNEGHVYARFRDRIEKDFSTPTAFADEIATIKGFAEYYDRLLRPAHEPQLEARTALERLNTLEITTGYPFLLAACDARDQGRLLERDFLETLRIVENYLVRRLLADEPTNYLNKMFPTLWRELDPTPAHYQTSLRTALATKNYPSDSKVRQAVATEEIYDRRPQTQRKICLVLETVNRRLSTGSGGYTHLDSDPTIEHIMPQTLTDVWKRELGASWQQTHEDLLHALGNLTLVTQEWNSALSNARFGDKKEKLATHALQLNKDYFGSHNGRWDDSAIQARADFLTKTILEIWPSIGEAPAPIGGGSRKPTSLTIMGETFFVQSWRDVTFRTAVVVSEVIDDFSVLVAKLPKYFSLEKFPNATSQLPNGWWVKLQLGAPKTKKVCRQMIATAGLSPDDWQVEEE